MSFSRASCVLALIAFSLRGQDIREMLDREFRARTPRGLIRTDIGVTRRGTPIPCLLSADDLDYETGKIRVLLVGGADGSSSSVESVLRSLQWFYAEGGSRRRQFALSAVPVLNPDGWAWGTGATNGSGGSPVRGYPPGGDAYRSPTDPEAAYVWRWIGVQAPDLVVEVRSDGPMGWHVPDPQFLTNLRRRHDMPPSGQLVSALGRFAPAGIGTIPAVQVQVGASWQVSFLGELLAALQNEHFTGPSPARREIQRRLGRTPLEIAQQLGGKYGYAPGEIPLKPALALMGRLPKGESSQPLTEPAFKDTISDSAFMECAVLAESGRLDLCARQLKSLSDLTRRADGLYRRSASDSTAFGRGNGLVAAGLALSLTKFPEEYPSRTEMLQTFQAVMDALSRYQDPAGAWRQVIDHPESYRELTATCLIAFAIRRGIRSGWLEAARFEPILRRAWTAIQARIGFDGTLIDVCETTPQQRSLQDYLDRVAILGADARGGAIALLAATEMMR